MASSSPSKGLTKRSLDTSLMPPPPPPKRIKRPAKVLGEDTYTDALDHIIARDFFPGLLEVQSKQDYLDALDSRDHEWITTAGRKLTEVMTPGPDGRRNRGRRGTSITPASGLHGRADETPKAWQGDTPMSVVSTTSTATSSKFVEPQVNTNMSLSAFQQKYTSEDNESAYKLLDKQNQKRAERYAWMWAGNKIPAARQIAYRKREALRAANRSAEEVENCGKQMMNLEPTKVRKAMPDTWISRPDNAFMFMPGSIEDTTQTVTQKSEETSLAPPKAVIYDNTRIAPPIPSELAIEVPPSPSISAIHDAISGRPRPTASEASFNGASTPRVNGYAFVDSEPEHPSSSYDTSTPLLLGSGDSTPNPFKLSESSKREALHHRMVDKVARGKRVVTGKRETELKTPTPRFMSSPRIAKGGLTPAAQKLLGKVDGSGVTPLRETPRGLWEGKTPKRSGLRQGWTPQVVEKDGN